MKVQNKKWSDAEFFETREEVLRGWPTGKDVDLKEAVDYLKRLPDHKNFAKKIRKAKEKGITTAEPRAGVALIDEHIKLLLHLQNEGGADFLPSTIDAYSRQNRYEECQRGIDQSKAAGRSLLNGFPGVNHGVHGARQVVEAVDLPVQMRHGTPDARLLAEVMHAGGYTSNEGGCISYNVPYAKSVSIEKSLIDWQYCDRLVGFYEENGVEINREPFGPLTGTLVPPSNSNTIGIIEALLAAEQGVKSITVGYGQCGNLYQDVAAIRALEEQTEAYLKEFGYDDCCVTTVFHQWMGGFPQDEAKAFGVIAWGSATAALAGATKVIVKTPHEAFGIPTKEANAQGIRTTKMVLNMLEGQRLLTCKRLQDEIDLIKLETKEIMDTVFKLGNGDLAVGTIKAFEAGVLDVPFAPSRYNKGLVMPARDFEGCVRYLDFGNVPFSKEVKDINREKLEKRGKDEGREPSFQMTVDDIFAVGLGKLIGRPQK
ncbi:methylaspartate mutase subunit E [Ezakiella coagulans]|uniref:methylaspartate mutase subunit E n=1 Tax=Ezakiella coagulans TaxID=46507 RepID=UPI002014F351|nr:methylaspartate mutase subunit E [Ezakiella coagulans]UQK61122.1 methylaspartate mutase subunit E [Ezakiella coagulans]